WTNDVWCLSLGDTPAWLPIVPSGALPPVRWGDSGVFDSTNRQLVIFGGTTSTGVYLPDAWELPLGPAVAVGAAAPPQRLAVLSAGPNPARHDWTIQFRSSASAAVSLRVFDAAGRVIRELRDAPLDSG